MTQTIEDLHVYLRTVRQNERTSLSVLAGLVNEGATVLDLGCGSGALGQYLKETKGCTSDGLTWSDAEAEHARPHYRHVSVADLEACNLLEIFAGKTYDFIVCADVLEHLRQPERVLEACRSLIKPQGLLLTSVPNAGYAGLVAELLQGDFRYRPEGLLDRTHLRFFTRRSLARFMGDNRWTLNSVDTIRRELPESEFSTPFDQLPPAVSRYLLAVQDSLTYQFIGVAQPAAAPVTGEQGGPPDTEPAHALFTAQLYLGHDGEYAEDRKLSQAGVIGRECQTLRFALPSSEHLTHLRFDPADRPGFMHLYSFTLRNAADEVVWTWSAHTESGALLAETPHSQLVWQSPLTAAAPATLLLLTGEDPWLQLPIDVHRIAEVAASGGALDVEIGWPMSADYLALAGCVRPLQSEITTSRARAAAEQERLRNERHAIEAAFERERLEAARRYQETTQAAEAERNRLLGEQNALLNIKDGLTRQRSELLRESAEHRRNSERLEEDLSRTQREFAELAQHLRSIESSTVFRATRPLVHTKMRIDRLLGRGPRHSPLSPEETEKKTSSARPLQPTSHPVDVIVPVYRGLADTQLCVDSVLASPVRVPYRLVVINDCSPEPEVTRWLRERASQDSRITLLENPENLGFVGTVNRGMALSESNDVLLLNSDTEVANDWLDRILSAAYSDQRIATVTPFSTNATICSYPQYCKDNALVPGYDTARMDALCARTNPGAMVDVPTGVGFCMYIRRDSLRQVGLFDIENFGKGYGEENDFCQRALQAGWRNVHLMDTFVLHTGGVSFGDSKSPRELAAMKTLARLHPRYARDVHAFVQADPARPYRLALDAARIAESGLPVILNVLHDRAGGTLRHVRELAEHLADQAVSLTLSPSPNHSVVLRLSREEEAFELTFQVDTQYEQLLDVLRRLGVGHVHFHHLLGHSQRIRDLPHHLGVAYDFTAHDYYSYCTHISLTGIDNRYAPEPGPGQCACCPPDMEAPAYGTVAQWRGVNARLLVGARHVFAPSHDTARRIRAFVPAVNVLTVPHTDVSRAESLPVTAPTGLRSGPALKVVVIGALSMIKGADVLEAVALEAAKRNAPVEFHLIGYAYRHLQTQPRSHLTVHGGYAEEDLLRLLEWLQPDLAWFPAQWPETYSYTLSAALQAGLPVAVGDLGAFSERVSGRPWSWICPWDEEAKSWLDRFVAMREEHFANGTAPTLEQSQPDASQVPETADWHYRTHYLQDLPAPTPLHSDSPAPWAPSQLQSYVAQPTPASHAKAGVLGAIVYLRSLPGLRGVARAIPAHWQRRLKSWLKA